MKTVNKKSSFYWSTATCSPFRDTGIASGMQRELSYIQRINLFYSVQIVS